MKRSTRLPGGGRRLPGDFGASLEPEFIDFCLGCNAPERSSNLANGFCAACRSCSASCAGCGRPFPIDHLYGGWCWACQHRDVPGVVL